MNSYSGRALVITHDGSEVPAAVSLRQYRDGLRTAWGGTIIPGSDGLDPLVNLTAGRLRLPGAEAEFLRPDASEWVRSDRLEIIGQDEAPF
jgi:hypothetical protein